MNRMGNGKLRLLSGKLVLIMAICGLLLINSSTVMGESGMMDDNFPKPRISKELLVIRTADMNRQEMTMIATLQGLIAQKTVKGEGKKHGKPQIYIDNGNNSYPVWLDKMRDDYRISYTYVKDPWELLEMYIEDIDGFITFKDQEDSINVATSLAGIRNAIAIDETLVEKAKLFGLSEQMDVRGKNEAWLKENYWDEFNHDIAIEQQEHFNYQMRDYAVMTKSMIFYDGNTAFRESVVNSLNTDSVILGWGDASKGEDIFISQSSKAGVYTLPADWASNLSVLSGVHHYRLKQKAKMTVPKADPNKHYVTFMMTDGDNVQWTLGDYKYGTKWFGSEQRGNFHMGWGLPPALIDLAPTVMKWYYDNASDSQYKDQFVVGPSGGGYMYPSQYPEEALDRHVTKLNNMMGRADLHLAQIIDFNSFDNTALWDKYTAQENIHGLFYFEYSRYSKHNGAIRWSNGKPVISAREMLWEGLAGCDNQSVINHINAAAKNPKSPDGYSVVLVHPWSKSLDDVKDVIDHLSADVEVVPPEVFVKLVTKNVEH
jgi:GxGYxYP putative glycoside hydrolase C-terminal domain/GxGYxY sequence motif in domain of unknown function N-terminal